LSSTGLEDSFHAVTVEAVAHWAGATRAVIYQHFTNVQALREAIASRESARALAQVLNRRWLRSARAIRRSGCWLVLAAYVRAMAEHPIHGGSCCCHPGARRPAYARASQPAGETCWHN